jgi:hypothetical protein
MDGMDGWMEVFHRYFHITTTCLYPNTKKLNSNNTELDKLNIAILAKQHVKNSQAHVESNSI